MGYRIWMHDREKMLRKLQGSRRGEVHLPVARPAYLVGVAVFPYGGRWKLHKLDVKWNAEIEA
jgi:hypothetical protein